MNGHGHRSEDLEPAAVSSARKATNQGLARTMRLLKMANQVFRGKRWRKLPKVQLLFFLECTQSLQKNRRSLGHTLDIANTENAVQRPRALTLPVAPPHKSLASRTTSLKLVLPASCSNSLLAARQPDTPDPIMTTEASAGRTIELRWWAIESGRG